MRSVEWESTTRRSSQELVDHLEGFELDLKFSAGIWFFSPADSRFHGKYQPDLTIEQRLDIAATLADDGLGALEAHYPNEINEDNVIARLEGFDRKFMVGRLRILGYLNIHTRQLDMIMLNSAAVSYHRKKIHADMQGLLGGVQAK